MLSLKLIAVAGTPTGLTLVLATHNMVKLSWSAPAKSTPPVAGYEVFLAVSGSDVIQGRTKTTNSTSTTVTGLSVNTTSYDFFVVAFSGAKNALPSAHSEILIVEKGK